MNQSHKEFLEQLERWRKENPWVIQNIQHGFMRCGRFPDRESAIEAGKKYRGGVIDVVDERQIVFVSEVPTL